MALAELSANTIARNGRPLETPPDSLPDDNPNPRTPNHRAKNGLLPTPSSIQSMLKNTTEIGEVGFHSSKHQRPKKSRVNDSITHEVHHTPPQGASGSLRSVIRTPRQNGFTYHQPSDRGTPYSVAHSQQGTVSGASSIYSLYRNRSETSFRSQPPLPSRGPYRGPEAIEDQSYFTMQHSSASRNLASNPMLLSSSSRGNTDSRSVRPRSPFIYPTRLKRPGYRPSSPALSEVYRSGMRSPHTSSRVPGFRTNSPLALHKAERTITGWQQSFNQLDPMLGAPHMSPKHQYTNWQYVEDRQHHRMNQHRVYNRAPTPMPISVSSNIPYVPHTENQPPPLFYDYSEGFQQEPFYHMSSLGSSSHQLTPENPNQYFYGLDTDIKHDSEPPIFELPADVPAFVTAAPGGPQERNEKIDFENPETVSKSFSYAESATRSATMPVEPSEQADVANELNSELTSTNDSPRVSSLPAVYDAEKADDDPMVAFTEAPGYDTKSHTERKMQQPGGAPKSPLVQSPVGHRTLPSYKRSQEFLEGRPNRTLGNANISLYSKRSPSLSSSNGSMYSTQSTSHPQRARPRTTDEPKTDDAPMAVSSKQQERHDPPMIWRNASPKAERASRPETVHTEIHSPIPKRSLSSPSHRDRFSNILSIDEEIPEVDTVAKISKRQARPSIVSIFAKRDRTSGKVEPNPSLFEEGYASSELYNTLEAQAAAVKNEYQASPTLRAQTYISEAYEMDKVIASCEESSPTEQPSGIARFSSARVPESMSKLNTSGVNLQEPSHVEDSVSRIRRNMSIYNDSSDTALSQITRQEDHTEPPTNSTHPLRPRSSIVSFAPPPQRDTAPLPFAFTPLRPEEREDDDSVTELGKLAASYLDQPDRCGRETPDTPPKRIEKTSSGGAGMIATIQTKRGAADSEHHNPETPPGFKSTVPESAAGLRQPQSNSPPQFGFKVQRTSALAGRTLKKKPRSSVENERASKEDHYTVGKRDYFCYLVPVLTICDSSIPVSQIILLRSNPSEEND